MNIIYKPTIIFNYIIKNYNFPFNNLKILYFITKKFKKILILFFLQKLNKKN